MVKAQVKTVYITDFGANGNDKKSDQAAFNMAATYINERKGNTRLVITKGKYIVGVLPKSGKETDLLISAASLNDVMQLKDCNNVTIEGIGNACIKFVNGLPFGTLANRLNNADSAVHIGSLFRLINCTNITILNIDADGNNGNFRLLKTWGVGPSPYEREHEGLFINNCQNISVNHVRFNNFGRDGAILIEERLMMPVKNISFNDCFFNGNGRNGVSWCGGENVRFYNCRFNNNSKGKIATNPGSGLDIEPERNAFCKKGEIIKCEFINNAGYAFISGYTDASDVLIDSCTIVGNTNYAVLCISPRFAFKNTSIAGTSLMTYDADNQKDGMQFENCNFTDSLHGKKIFTSNYLTAITGRYARFEKCVFTGFKIPVIYTEIKKKESKTNVENTLFSACSFNVFFKKASTWGQYAFLVSHSNFVDCRFTSGGYADFKRILNDKEKNVQNQRGSFINN